MPRELLKFRQGDVGLKIMKDGQMEVAGVNEESPMIDKNGKVNPALLFAAAWARKDQATFQALVQNFKDAVLEGFFGTDAQNDYKRALEVQAEHEASNKESNESDAAPGAVTFERPVDEKIEYQSEEASGAVTFEQPKPLTSEEAVTRRDS